MTSGRRPRPAPGPQLGQSPHHVLRQSPALIHYLSLLPLTLAEVHDLVERSLASNPMLTRAPGGPCPGCGRHTPRGGPCRECRVGRVHPDAAVQVDWRDELERQSRLELPRSLHAAIGQVVGSLDDGGLLATPPAGIPEPALTRVVAALRTLGPPGIAAASPLECARLQVDALVDAGALPAFARELLTRHVEEVAAGDMDAVSRSVGVHVEAVEDALEVIRDRVRPYVALVTAERRPGAPDVVFSWSRTHGGEVAVEVADASWFGLALDEEAWSQAGTAGRAWLTPHRRDAERVLAGLGARATTLRRLAEFLAVSQRAFLVDGAAHHRPLTRAQASEELGCHPSTVTRVVQGKWARCPDGRMIPLSACFGVNTAAVTAVERALEAHPGAGDDAIRRVLAADGLQLARRTVAKYRRLARG